MLKSVFSKYLVTFLVIIVISFFVLSGVVCSMVSGYSASAKEDAVVSGAGYVPDFLAENYNESYSGSFSQYVYLHRDMLGGALELASSDDAEHLVLVTDEEGIILLSGTGDAKYVSTALDREALLSMAEDPAAITLTDLSGLLDAKYMV